jgi:hypothetical protein
MSDQGFEEFMDEQMAGEEAKVLAGENARAEADAMARDVDAQHMIDDLNAKDAEIKALRDTVRNLIIQFGSYNNKGGIGTSGLSALEDAFDALGWDDPHEIPEMTCDEPGCKKHITCGWPSPIGYRRTCGDHYRAALGVKEAKPSPVKEDKDDRGKTCRI